MFMVLFNQTSVLEGLKVKSKNNKRLIKFCIVIMSFMLFALVFGISNIYKTYAFDDKQHLYTEIVVEPGDSLWSIAEDCSENSDVRKLIYEITEINNLEQENIFPGQVLMVPVIK